MDLAMAELPNRCPETVTGMWKLIILNLSFNDFLRISRVNRKLRRILADPTFVAEWMRRAGDWYQTCLTVAMLAKVGGIEPILVESVAGAISSIRRGKKVRTVENGYARELHRIFCTVRGPYTSVESQPLPWGHLIPMYRTRIERHECTHTPIYASGCWTEIVVLEDNHAVVAILHTTGDGWGVGTPECFVKTRESVKYKLVNTARANSHGILMDIDTAGVVLPPVRMICDDGTAYDRKVFDEPRWTYEDYAAGRVR